MMQSTFLNLLADDGVKPGGFWFPTDATASNQVDGPAFFILWVCAFFVFFNAGLMVFFAIRYRQKEKAGAAHGSTHNTALEVTWSAIPAVILGIIFYWGFVNFLEMEEAPDHPMEVHVVGQRWFWDFYYEDGQSANSWTNDSGVTEPAGLWVPADQPIRLTLESTDVIHSVSIPAMRVKRDCVPGRYNQLWFEAVYDEDNVLVRSMSDGEGGFVDVRYNRYDLFCTEYCGTDHSTMITYVYVVHPDDFDLWLQYQDLTDPGASTAELGRQIWEQRCVSCHSNTETDGIGPGWANMYGNPNHPTESGERPADNAYIIESIRNPGAVYAQGFDGVSMTAFGENQLSARDIACLIEYMKTLSPDFFPEEAEAGDTGVTWGDLAVDGSIIGEGEDGDAEGDAETEGEGTETEDAPDAEGDVLEEYGDAAEDNG